MNDQVRQTLQTMIRDYGRAVCQDPRRCKALLLDLCARQRREVNVLVAALEERVVDDLLTATPSVPLETTLARLRNRLETERGLAPDAAHWAVESWALALGVIAEPLPPARGTDGTSINVPAEDSLAAAVAAAPVGATLHLAAGIHHLAQPLIMERPLRLLGVGRDVTRIIGTGADTVIKIRGTGRYGLEHLSVEHQGPQVANVVEVVDAEVAIHHCRFTGGVRDTHQGKGGTGLWLHGQAHGHITTCLCEGNALHGITVAAQAQPTLEGNTCRDNTYNGIGYFGNAAGQATGNTCTGNGYYGIQVADQAQPTLEGNTCRDNTKSGIRYSGNAAGQATGNTCTENGYHGISVAAQAHPTLEGNTCTRNKLHGIAYFNNATGRAMHNTCIENKISGIQIEHAAQPMLEANTCRNNGGKDINDNR